MVIQFMKPKIALTAAFAALSFSFSNAQTLCENGFAGEFPCLNVDLMSHLPIDQIGGGANMNDIWGWTSPVTGREYAIACRSTGTSFIDITDPVNPIYLGDLHTHTTPSLWRDAKVFNDYAFIVSEAGNHGLQVFDLLQLDSVVGTGNTFEETAHYGQFGNAHNIAINESTGYAYCVGSNTFNGGLHIVNINDPLNPVIAGEFATDGYTHDTQVVIYDGPDAAWVGKEIAFLANATKFSIADVTDKADVQLIATSGYSDLGYTHQGWLTEDHKFFLLDDEMDETNFGMNTRTLIWDVQDLDNPVHIGSYVSSIASSDHNLYTRGNYVFESNYSGGLRILNLENVGQANLFEAGYFDTEPNSNAVGYNGSWSNYPYFASGNVVVNSMYNGFFVVKPKDFFFQSVEEAKAEQSKKLRTYPNPASAHVKVEIPAWAGQFKAKISICNLMGIEQTGTQYQWMTSGQYTLDVSSLSGGYYIIRVEHPAGLLYSTLIVE